MSDKQKSLTYLTKYLKNYKKPILISITFYLIATIAQVIAPSLLGQAVTNLSAFVKGHGSLGVFYQALAWMAGFYVFNSVATYIAWMMMTRFNANANNDMRKGLFGKLQRMTIRYFDTHQDGQILSLFNSDLDNIFNALNNAFFEIISQSLLFVGTIIVMFVINWKLALSVVATTPLILLLSWIIMKKAHVYLDNQQDRVGELNAYINEQLNGENVIITQGLKDQSVAGFKKENAKVREAMFKGQFYSGILNPLVSGFSLLNFAIVIATGAYMIMTKQVSQAAGLGLIVTFTEYSWTYFQPLTQVTSIYSMLQLALTGARRLETVEEQEEENTVPDGKTISGVNDAVRLEDVHFGYTPDKEILHGVSIEVPKGQSVAVVGPTGSGKTTIMNLINRFYDVNSGAVTFDGVDVRDLKLENLRSNVGIVLQDSVLFSGTVADNIRYGKPEASMDEVIAAAKEAQLHDFVMTLPEQYDTPIENGQANFSTGQKQLLSIARTILVDPAFLILDEATSNVDTVTEEKIQKAMDNVIAGRTSFVIAHRLKTILNSDKIVVLKDGQVIEEGPHADLIKKRSFYYKLYTSQMAFE
ncbi:ABC transporter ATP-binding protein/permease [Lactobacillus delbrueckii subsp. lactis]|uniref:ABC transporter ATP-binding protein n=1 Tax=Lactobacillus delbrueckii TaxID=1584 RepID=UPI0001EC325F|nr:ABC transporter ATP-binding protein [Lactobacillus delbrueckii]ADQ61031.1 ABC-type multidrug transport system, ATPase and permease component [Lactobacillus delbrueckii subsp. bulgaricus ND02]MBO3082004.1 ABC transporter ATP-binding protein [Lactobacillus delbrueckii subsp. bulgaricus]MCD5438401.1 ABC transporter ATP-binding protein/permease [Lactobacillus delbrueckii subsp. lactis]MCD5469049.1 ABC transporter ATP-binding protein/permease [Lactobacillus delbrueckii subsp. lactis]MCZ0796463.1